MSATTTLFEQSRRVREKLPELMLYLAGHACLGAIRRYDDRATRRGFDRELAGLLKGTDDSADLTLTCELLFLRFRDRAAEVGDVDGMRVDRLIQQPSADRYTVVERYLNLSEEMRIDDVRYTIMLYGPQYLGPDGFDRAGMRITCSSRCSRVDVQAFIRRGDALADELHANPAVNLQRACRAIEYTATVIPDAVAVTKWLEAEEPVPCSNAR
jgi:hypothetical protein